MEFGTAVKTCFSKYATFSGRACRSEYWYFALFMVICELVAGVLDVSFYAETNTSAPFAAIFIIVTFLPGLGVIVRRLHDVDRSGWWYFIAFVPLIGFVVLLIWFCKQGTRGPNRYGHDPLPNTDLTAVMIESTPHN